MQKTAKLTRIIGVALAALGITIICVAWFVIDGDSESYFPTIAAGFFFYIPGVILWLLGHLVAQLDHRISLLEDKLLQ